MSFTLPAATDTTFEQCPEGLWIFRLASMEDGIIGNPEYGDKPRVKWVFEIERVIDANENEPTRDIPNPKPIEDWIGEEFWGWSSKTMAKGATMRAWAEALLGREIPEGEQLKASDLIGKRGKATVGRGKTGRQKITSLLPAKSKPKAAPEPEPETDEDEF